MELVFQLGNELIFVRVRGKEVTLSHQSTGFREFPIEMLIDMDKSIKDKDKVKREWKEGMDKLHTEKEVENYVILELEQKGFTLLRKKE